MANKRLYFRPSFLDMTPGWRQLADKGKRIEILPGESFHPADRDLVFVYAGYVFFSCDSTEGDKRLACSFGRDCIANVGAMITGSNQYVTLSTNSAGSLVLFDAYQCLDYAFMREHPALFKELAGSLAATSAFYSARAYHSYFYTSQSRICRFLCTMTTEAADTSIHLGPITQNTIARLAGVHHVTLSNVLGNLKSEGIIGELTVSYVDVLDYEALCGLAAAV